MKLLLFPSLSTNLPLFSRIFREAIGSRSSTFSMSSTSSNVVLGEEALKEKLKSNFPLASSIVVEDISGGCGSMFQVLVETTEFKGLSTIKQHQLINKVLKEEITLMHGIRITTKIPSS